MKFVRTFDNIDWIRPKLKPKEVLAKYGFPLVSKQISGLANIGKNHKNTKRGMARAGWFMNLLYLGEKIFTFKVAPDALALGKKFSLVQWVARGIKPVCEIENRVPNIERYASYSKAYGMGKAANRINYICRIEKKKIEDAGNVYIS